MTTIAFKDGLMAADSCVSTYGLQIASMQKIHRTSAGVLIGQAGEADVRSVLLAIDKIKTSDKLPTKVEIAAFQTDFEFLIAFSPNNLWVMGCNEENGRYSGYVYQASTPYMATGSGWQLALGAMASGKSAREAVAIACKFDCFSRLPVHTVGFEPRSKAKPKPKPK